MRGTLADRLTARTAADGDCLVWTGCTNSKGYGSIWTRDGMKLAHRIAYELAVGPIPDGLVIDHLCRNRRCVHVPHLEVVTRGENTLRSPINFAAINARKTHCIRGHEFTAANTQISGGTRHCRACQKAWRAAA